jgi:hypothetical protein
MKQPRSYTRHGYHALKRRVMMAGTDAIDRRSAGGRELRSWIENQVIHLGGKNEITHPEFTLVKRASVLEVLIRQAEGDLLSRGILIGRRRRQVHPLLPEYRAMIREQREVLTLLGLKRQAIPLSLADAIESVKASSSELPAEPPELPVERPAGPPELPA